MGTPQCNYHKKIDKWRVFEAENDELQKNRDKYAGIAATPENYAFIYRWKGRQVKCCNRLADIYEFKLQWEKEHDKNTHE